MFAREHTEITILKLFYQKNLIFSEFISAQLIMAMKNDKSTSNQLKVRVLR